MNTISQVRIPECILEEVANRVATEFVNCARGLTEEQFIQALCPSHQRSTLFYSLAA